MRQEGGDATAAQQLALLLGRLASFAEDNSFLTTVQRGDHRRSVVEGARRSAKNSRCATRVLTNMDSTDSGVVSRTSGRLARLLRRPEDRRHRATPPRAGPSQPAYVSSRHAVHWRAGTKPDHARCTNVRDSTATMPYSR
jgi:hypothetical protein